MRSLEQNTLRPHWRSIVSEVIRLCCGIFAVLLMCEQHVQAADLDGQFSVQGIGTLRCSEIVQKVDTNSPDLVAVVAWSDGVLTAQNRLEKGVFNVMPFSDPVGIFTMLAVNLCRQKPDLIYDSAVVQVINLLKPVYILQSSEQTTATVGAETIKIYPQLIIQAQERLIKLGYMNGPSDGVFGTATMEGMKKFQMSASLRVTGMPDVISLLALLRAEGN